MRWPWSKKALLRPMSFVFHNDYELVTGPVPLDPHRAGNVLAYLLNEKLVDWPQVLTPRVASIRKLRLVHSDEHLATVSNPSSMAAVFGQVSDDALLERVFTLQRHYVGGTLLAVNHAVSQNRHVVHLGGGLHHAHPGRAHGFCLFNDVAIAVRNLRSRGDRRKIAIIDLDYHDGDGTRDCLATDNQVRNVSLHAVDFDQNRPANARVIALGTEVSLHTYLKKLEEELAAVRAWEPELIIYVNGVDVAEDDLLGSWKFDSNAIAMRDQAVFSMLESLPMPPPCVTLLSGGYGNNAWKHIAYSLARLISGVTHQPTSGHVMALARLSEKRSAHDPINDSQELSFSEEDLGGVSSVPRPQRRFLGYYTQTMLEFSLERYEVLERLRKLGYARPEVRVSLGAPMGDTLRVVNVRQAGVEELLAEVTVRRDAQVVRGYDILYIEWLMLQHPRSTMFRALLPGQRHAGLGMSGEALGLLVFVAQRLNLDGLAFTPSHFHLAKIASHSMSFLDNDARRRFERLVELTSGMPLGDASTALAQGTLIDPHTRRPAVFKPAIMVMALNDGLRQVLATEADDSV